MIVVPVTGGPPDIMVVVAGVEYCREHGGVLFEGTDYCQFQEVDTDEPCIPAPLYYKIEGS